VAAQNNTGCIILGAGVSRRFGADKRMQPLGERTIAQTTLKLYCSAFKDVRLVLREDDNPAHIVGDLYNQGNLQIIRAPMAHLGMGHSLSAGFVDLDWQWSFMALLDMPYVQLKTLQDLIAHAEASNSTLVQPRLIESSAATLGRAPERKKGHPIGIHHSLFAQVRTSIGDQGARWLLKEYAAQIDYFDSHDPGVIQDIDNPTDLPNAY
jgi:molybdenum cofactor cytidylyltransferase